MSSTPREIGTLIVVILKAKHLPNKRHIGKQDPYCSVYHNGEKRRTKAIKRGGQHPEWDEEVRFTLYEDAELDYAANGGGATPPPPPPKNERSLRKIKGGTIMRLACFADDPREPDLIGETMVDLTEVLTKGETDEWFTLLHKDKYSGEVYLELTFWSNEPAPQKKRVTKPPVSNRLYGGPGSFTPSVDGTSNVHPGSRVASMSVLSQHGRQVSDNYPPRIRTSSSVAQLDLYVPPYGRRSPYADTDQVANDFGELGISEPARRRESLPVPTYGSRPVSYTSNSSISQSYSQSYAYAADDTNNSFSRSMTTPVPQPPASRGPRYSIPASSSGFQPLPNTSNTLAYASMPSYPSEPSMFSAPSVPQTPQPGLYSGSYSQSSGFNPAPSVAPTPSPSAMYSQGPENHHAYPVQYTPPALPPPQQYSYGTTPSPSREQKTPYPGSHITGMGSRPLPQPTGPPQVQPLGPSPTGIPFPANNYSPNRMQPKTPFPSQESSIPPPPPLPSLLQSMANVPMPTGGPPSTTLALPPPPPLPSTIGSVRPRRHSSLPPPPVNPQQNRQISLYNSIPPPPPPPMGGELVHIKPGLPIPPVSSTYGSYQPSPPRPQLPAPPVHQSYITQQGWN